jgi:hypothetical protein
MRRLHSLIIVSDAFVLSEACRTTVFSNIQNNRLRILKLSTTKPQIKRTKNKLKTFTY